VSMIRSASGTARSLTVIALTVAGAFAVASAPASAEAIRTSAPVTAAHSAATEPIPAAATDAQPAAGRATGRWASGYTGKQVHATWAGPDVGLTAWTVSLSVDTYKKCHGSWTTVDVDVAWDSSALHNGADLVLMLSVMTSDGHWHGIGRPMIISKAVPWPGHPAFGGQFRAQVYTPAASTSQSATSKAGSTTMMSPSPTRRAPATR
jgi:hypothetical protein